MTAPQVGDRGGDRRHRGAAQPGARGANPAFPALLLVLWLLPEPALSGAAEAPLACGERGAFVRIDTAEVRIVESFALIRSMEWYRARPEWQEGRGEQAKRGDEAMIVEPARGAVKYLAERTGLPCSACDADGSVDWDSLGDDLALWKRAATDYGPRSRRELLDEQRACVSRAVHARVAELDAIGRAIRAGGGTETGTDPLPDRVQLAFSSLAAAEVALDPLARRPAWTTREIEQALAFAARLKTFLDRGTPEAWRALAGLEDPAAYAAAVRTEAAAVVSRTDALRVRLDAFERDLIEFVELGSPAPPSGGGAPDGRSEQEHARGERLVNETVSLAAGTHECRRIRVREGERTAATVTLCLPSATLMMETAMVLQHRDGLAALRERIAAFRRAIDDTAAMATRGVRFDPAGGG